MGGKRIDTPHTGLQINDLAHRTGLSKAAIRACDDLGLLSSAPPGAAGSRRYTDTDVHRLTVLRDLAPLDFSLAEKRCLLVVLDSLADPSLSWRERADAPIKLDMYREIAAYRIAALSEQLAAAEAFATTLETHAPPPRHPHDAAAARLEDDR